MIDASMFDFDAMKEATGADPFADKNNRQYETDDRFYKLTRNEDGSGAQIIRFLPDSERGLIQQVFKINTTVTKDGKRRFVNELSPQTIGKPCPFQEEWAKLWNAGEKEAARTFSRTTRYYANIKVIRDPAKPENEGKIFLLDMSNTMKNKIQSLLEPSEQDIALGAEPKQLFNPLKGNSFKLACKMGSNNIITYDPSEAVNQVDGIYETVEEALADIKENTHRLSQFLEEDAYLSYEELQRKKEWVTFSEHGTTQVSSDSLVNNAESVTNQGTEVQPEVHEPVQATQAPTQAPTQEKDQATQTTQSDNLDDLLASLV